MDGSVERSTELTPKAHRRQTCLSVKKALRHNTIQPPEPLLLTFGVIWDFHEKLTGVIKLCTAPVT